jgi:hypothetical protein
MPLLVVLTLAACGPTLTKPQQLVHDAYDVCRNQGGSAKLETVSTEGRWSLVGREGEVQKVNACMGRYTRQASQPPPAAEPAPAAKPVTDAIRVPGTWKGMLRLAARSGETVPPSPVTLRLLKDGGSLRWQLTTTSTGTDATATGVALITGDRLRLTGHIRTPSAAGRPGADGTRLLEVVYMGQLAGDTLDVTGLTADQQVHVLSLRRVGD